MLDLVRHVLWGSEDEDLEDVVGMDTDEASDIDEEFEKLSNCPDE